MSKGTPSVPTKTVLSRVTQTCATPLESTLIEVEVQSDVVNAGVDVVSEVAGVTESTVVSGVVSVFSVVGSAGRLVSVASVVGSAAGLVCVTRVVNWIVVVWPSLIMTSATGIMVVT